MENVVGFNGGIFEREGKSKRTYRIFECLDMAVMKYCLHKSYNEYY